MVHENLRWWEPGLERAGKILVIYNLVTPTPDGMVTGSNGSHIRQSMKIGIWDGGAVWRWHYARISRNKI